MVGGRDDSLEARCEAGGRAGRMVGEMNGWLECGRDGGLVGGREGDMIGWMDGGREKRLFGWMECGREG
jgi:hypothetical protein